MERKPKIILVVFHLPSILSDEDFSSEHFVFATFSNQAHANHVFVNALTDPNYKVKDSSYLPVAIGQSVHPSVVREYDEPTVSKIKKEFSKLEPKFEVHLPDTQPYTPVSLKTGQDQKVKLKKKTPFEKSPAYYISSILALIVSLLVLYKVLKVQLLVSIIILVVSMLIHFYCSDLLTQVIINKLTGGSGIPLQTDLVFHGLIALTLPFFLYYAWKKIM